MLLATTDTLRAQLGFDPMPDSMTAMRVALSMATSRLQSNLRTPFEKVTGQVDVFLLDSNTFYRKLKLTRGFVSSVAVEKSVGDYSGELTWEVVTTLCSVNTERGVVGIFQVPDAAPANYRITYTAGFDLTVGDATLYAAVPTWLRDAALLAAKISLVDDPRFKEAKIVLDRKGMENLYSTIIEPKVRYEPAAALAI